MTTVVHGSTLITYCNLGLDNGQLILGGLQFLIGLVESESLGLDVTVDVVELDDVDDPRAQTTGGQRLALDVVSFKLWVGEVLFDGLLAVLVDVLLVVVDQRVKELINLWGKRIN